MFIWIIPLVVAGVLLVQAPPAFGGVSKAAVFQIAVTIPPHVMSGGLHSSFHNAYQIVQTQTVIRNNHVVTIKSIVVP